MLAYLFAPGGSGDDGTNGASSDHEGQGSPEFLEEDAALVARIRGGEDKPGDAERAFSALIQRSSAPLYAYALSFTRDPDAARDLVQECFADLWIHRNELNPSNSLLKHLLGAVRFRALHLLRRRRLEQQYAAPDIESENTTQTSSGYVAADDVVEQADLYAAVVRTARSLPPRSARVFALRWGEGLSYAEISKKLGISVKGVEIQMTRALRFIRSRLEGSRE